MGNFVVSARKYRPIRFDSVVGQQHVSNTLKNAIKQDHLAQAFLFCGPRGVGKTTCARILAKVLNCQNPTEDTEPCDTCGSCRSFNENASLNIHELDAASNNSVEHIRSLIEQVRFAPQSGKYKIYIIDEVHMLSQAAFNAFLKTLEEPPSYAIFILATTEKHKIIPTILSRCQIFDFNRIQIRDMVAHLHKICKEENIQAEEDALNVIAQKADGALRDALSIFDRIVSFSGNNILYADVIENLNILDYSYYFKITAAIAGSQMSALLLLFDTILQKGFDGELFINGLAEHLRNVLVCQDTSTVQLLGVSGAIQQQYLEQAKLIPTSLILSALSIANDCDVNYKMAQNKRLHVEMALIKMAHIQQALNNLIPISSQAVPATNPIEKKNSPLELATVPTQPVITKAAKTEETIAEVSARPKEEEQTTDIHSKETIIETIPTVAPNLTIEKKEEKQEQQALSPLGGGGDLLKQMMQSVQEESESYKPSALEFTDENAAKLWKEHCATITSPSQLSILKNAKLKVDIEANKLSITVQSKRGQDAIQRDIELSKHIKQTFQRLDMTIEVQVDATKIEQAPPPKKLPTTDKEKYRFFREKNPLIDQFQKQFQLFPPDKA